MALEQRCLDTTVWQNAEPIVTDVENGLVWRGCVSGTFGRGCLNGTAATANFVNAEQSCQNLNWAGRNDWRLPTFQELASLVDLTSIVELRVNPFSFSHLVHEAGLLQVWSSTRTVDGNYLTNPFQYGPRTPSSAQLFTCVQSI